MHKKYCKIRLLALGTSLHSCKLTKSFGSSFFFFLVLTFHASSKIYEEVLQGTIIIRVFNLEKQLFTCSDSFGKKKYSEGFWLVDLVDLQISCTHCIWGIILKSTNQSYTVQLPLISKETGSLISHCIKENLPSSLIAEMELRYVQEELDTVHLCMEFPNTEKYANFFSDNYP